MSTRLTNNDGNTKLDTRSKSNNCSSVNENDVVVEVIMPPPEFQSSRKKRKNIRYGIILLKAFYIVTMIHMLNVIIGMWCMYVIQEGM